MICCFEKHFIGYLQNIVCIKIAFYIYLNYTNFLNFCSRWNQQNLTIIRSWRAPSSGEIWQSLVHKRQIRKRLKEWAAQSFLANHQFSWQTSETSSTYFWDPNAPLEPKNPKNPSREPPQKWFSFRKCDERGWKSTLSTSPLKEIS